MTREEALAALEAAGYKIEAPKSELEKLREELSAKQQQQFDELKALILAGQSGNNQQTTQRQTLVESQNVQSITQATPGNPKIYRHGNYLKEQLAPTNWAQLADRSQPLPEGVNPDWALNEMSAFLSAEITERYAQMGTITLIGG